MDGYVLTVQRVIAAPPEAVFEVLADAGKHHLIDGSGMLQGANHGAASASPSGRASAWG